MKTLRIPRRIRGGRAQRGGSFIELMVAGLLLSISMMAMVNMWVFSFRMTSGTDDLAAAYNLGRQVMETVKLQGFTGASEGTVTNYYDGKLAYNPPTASRRFSVTTSVVSSSVKSGTIGQAGAVPADYSRRTVTIDVVVLDTNQTLYHTTTYLVRAGI